MYFQCKDISEIFKIHKLKKMELCSDKKGEIQSTLVNETMHYGYFT